MAAADVQVFPGWDGWPAAEEELSSLLPWVVEVRVSEWRDWDSAASGCGERPAPQERLWAQYAHARDVIGAIGAGR